MASRIAWWGTGASIFRPLKNQPSPGFGTQLQMFKLWMKEEKWGQILDMWSALCQMLWDWERLACLTFQDEPAWLYISMGPPISSVAFITLVILSGCHRAAEPWFKPWPHCLLNWVVLAKSLNLLFFSSQTLPPETLIQESACSPNTLGRASGIICSYEPLLTLLRMRKLAQESENFPSNLLSLF